MARIVWSSRATREYQIVLNTIEREAGAAVRSKWRRKIDKAVKALERFPAIGSPVEEFGILGLREQIVAPYRIIYLHAGDVFRILKVIRADRDLDAVLSMADLL